MKDLLKSFFETQNIEYFSVLSYDDCREINSRIIDRQGFKPKSIIIYLLPYYTGDTVNLSCYAASLDYHIAIAEVNASLEQLLKERFPDAAIKGYGDHSPIDERHAALISGLGIAGDSGLLINEKYGTYVFIADIVTNIDPQLLGASAPLPVKYCESCGACKYVCPTGILRGEGNDCLSAITQRKGELTDEEKQLMRECNTLWGCDLCQTSCPYNYGISLTPVDFFYRERIPCLTAEILDSMSDEEISRRAFAWRKRKTVERNIEILYGKK